MLIYLRVRAKTGMCLRKMIENIRDQRVKNTEKTFIFSFGFYYYTKINPKCVRSLVW